MAYNDRWVYLLNELQSSTSSLSKSPCYRMLFRAEPEDKGEGRECPG